MAEQLPPRSFLDDEAFMAAWAQMSSNIRSEVLRAEREIVRGKAIQRDRIMGRGKYAMNGFYGLELAEENAYRLEHEPRRADELEEARKEVRRLQAALADDALEVERIMAAEAALDEHRQHAAAQGLTLAGYIRRAHSIEKAFYRAQAAWHAGDGTGVTDGIMDGLCQLGEWIGFDPAQMLLDAYNGEVH